MNNHSKTIAELEAMKERIVPGAKRQDDEYLRYLQDKFGHPLAGQEVTAKTVHWLIDREIAEIKHQDTKDKYYG